MSVDFDRHREFNGKVGAYTYFLLEILSKLSDGNEFCLSDLDLLKTINIRVLDANKLPENRMKLSVHYIRLCKIIDNLLKEYENYDDEFKKTVIDYYIQSNSIKEMNSIGLGWYYDVKYRKETSTLYSVGYGVDSNWHEWLKNSYNENNKIKENGVQSFFYACKEHINPGGKIRLKSLSKCFGIDLFKYMQLDRNGNANLYIIKDAPINFIEYEGSKITLQEYLLSDFDFDAKKNPEFCFDFSHPRNEEKKILIPGPRSF
ncbi:hypothetical protein [Paenibacillus hexagrammi]|uniref:Uncharacterized protein n=1 Tax=Paenibacillus hexagrammi TaxID=2908839 RepID=A0ABY3SJN0_9BACL|nr:hypothetical protein [Paenibacillus sp. YPD9-1]UJF33740.1 hypothetical protein L0M14_00270 [Paenibacillus sp. YPD9-1]